MGFSRQEYWSGLPFPSPGDLPNPGIEPRSPELHADALTSEPPAQIREAEGIKKRWQECTELCKKDLNDSDNHNGVITHLEPDILECKVKWALGSITMNKASGGDGIPGNLLQILKDDAVKCCTQYASKLGKLSSGHRTGKGQISFQFHRKAMSKNAQSTAQKHTSHMLAK